MLAVVRAVIHDAITAGMRAKLLFIRPARRALLGPEDSQRRPTLARSPARANTVRVLSTSTYVSRDLGEPSTIVPIAAKRGPNVCPRSTERRDVAIAVERGVTGRGWVLTIVTRTGRKHVARMSSRCRTIFVPHELLRNTCADLF